MRGGSEREGEGSEREQEEVRGVRGAPSSLHPRSSLPMGNEQFSMYWGPHHLWGDNGLGGKNWEGAGSRGSNYNQ